MVDGTLTIPDWVLTVGQVVLSPLLGAAAGLWAKSREERERIKAHIAWWVRGDIDENPENLPFILVQNLTQRPVHVVEVSVRWGPRYLFRAQETALLWEDWDDVEFPYAIAPGEIWHKILDQRLIARRADSAWLPSKWLGLAIARPRAKIMVRTLAGAVTWTNAEAALASRNQPDWIADRWWARLWRFLQKRRPGRGVRADDGGEE